MIPKKTQLRSSKKNTGKRDSMPISAFLKDPKTLKKIREFSKMNMRETEIVRRLGVNIATYKHTKSENKELFNKYIFEGRQEGISLAVTKLYNEVKKGNVSAIKFYLSNMDRESWGAGVNLGASIKSADTEVKFIINTISSD